MNSNPSRTRLIALTLVVLGGFVVTTAVPRRPKPEPCPGGRFLLADGDDPLLAADTSDGSDAVLLEDGMVSIPGVCEPIEAKIRAKRLKTRVKARWDTCGDFERVRLKGQIKDGCTRLAGKVRARKTPVRKFTALLVRCGDGIVEPAGGEECEPSFDDCPPGTTCDLECRCTPETATTTTATTPNSTTSSSAATTSTTTTTTLPVTSTTLPTEPPPDPATLASEVDQTIAADIAATTSFLFDGPVPVQVNVTPGAIEPRRVAILRGAVRDRTGSPITGVLISILDHPELGQTLTRADGRFDLAVNGGAPLTIDYRRDGFLPAQRQVDVPWRDWVTAPDVVLVPLDPVATVVDLGAAVPVQVARGSVQSDAQGDRQATLLVPQGVTAAMVHADGSTTPLTQLTVRATEYTVGDTGPEAMPGILPPTSGYTYAVELSVDEAMAAGATMVSFDQPLPFYVENFVNFPVGMTVPVGYYDRATARWVAAPNGRVVGVVGITGDRADLDVTGDGMADTGAALEALGVTDAERTQLAQLYAPGQTLWRAPIPHFTPWDHNWPVGPPADAIGPNGDPPLTSTGYDGACEAAGSIIDCESQTLGEAVGLAGTRFALRYRSDRVPGRTAVLEIPVTGAELPSSLIEARVHVDVAGQSHTQAFPPAPNQTTHFVWNGHDAYGRPVQGAQTVRVKIDFVYPAIYTQPSQGAQAFAVPGDGVVGDALVRDEILISNTYITTLARPDLRPLGLGGWALDHHHLYDPTEQAVRFGNGRVRRAKALGRMITRVTLGGFAPDRTGFAVGADGSVYFVTRGSGQQPQIRRRAPDGTVTVVAGDATSTLVRPYGDGGPALSARLLIPLHLEVGPDGSLYIVDVNVIRRVRPDGIIELVAGMRDGPDGGVGESCTGTITDGVPATESRMCPQPGFVVAPDGTIYFSDQLDGRRVRRVGPDGLVTTVAGMSTTCNNFFSFNPCGDGGPATQAELFHVSDLELASDGSLYLVDGATIRRIGPDGIISRVANRRGDGGFAGDGGPALEARFSGGSIAVEADGTIHVADLGNHRIRTIDPDGTVRTVAGTGETCFSGQDCNSGDGGPLGQARVLFPTEIELAPDGSVYFSVAQGQDIRIRRIGPSLPGFADGDFLIPETHGGAVHHFDQTGRHLRTRHALTGAPLLEFDYDTAGRLIRAREMTGGADNVTTIEHDAAGNPTAVVGPFGDRTELAVDGEGFLATVTNPAGDVNHFAYTADGLMTAHTDPRGHATTFTHDADGRLTLDTDPGGGSQALVRGELPSGFAVARTTALGLTTSYAVETPTPGVERRQLLAPDGTVTQGDRWIDGATATVTHANGTIGTMTSAPDPRFAMQAPLAASHGVRLPSALERITTTTREVTLAEPENPLSLTSLTDRITVGGDETTVQWDGPTRAFTFTSPAGRLRTLKLDVLGRVTELAGPGIASSTLEYDARGRLERVTTGTGAAARVVTYAYDTRGRPASITDPIGRTLGLAYDDAGRRIATTRPDGAVVGFAWDGANNLLALTPPDRPAHGFTWDARGALASVVPPALPGGTGPTQYATDTDGRLATITRPDGDVVTIGYDAGGRLATRTVSHDGNPVAIETMTYDAAGRLASLTVPGPLTTTYAWDGSLPRSESWDGAVSGSVAVTWDAKFRPATESVNGGHEVGFAWDGDGLSTAAGDLTITRDPQTGLPTAATLGNVVEAMTWDPFGGALGHQVDVGESTLYVTSWTRDPLGRASERHETVGAGAQRDFAYAYDMLGRLTEVRHDGALVETYAYDINGNRTSATVNGVVRNGTYDDQDRLTAYGAATYTYDPLGRLETATVGGGTTSYRYDPLGPLAEVELPDGNRVGYLTDGHGRRVGRLKNGVLEQGFLYAGGLRPVAELDGAGEVISRFVHAGGTVPAYLVKGTDTYRLITDAVGSVRLVVHAGTGDVVQEREYDAFGNPTLDTNPGFQPFGFAGGLHDPDTGLVRFGARDYDPATGRFTTADPIGFIGGSTNLYTYAGNDPVNAADPTGLDADGWTTWAAGVVRGIGNGLRGTATMVRLLSPWGLLQLGGDVLFRNLFEHLTGYEPDLWNVLQNAIEQQLMVNRDSGQYVVGEICGLGLSGFAFGGVAGAAGRGATVAAEQALVTGTTRALAQAGWSRAPNFLVQSLREGELGAARVLSNEAAALESAAAQQVTRLAEGGLQLVRTAQGSGYGAWWRAGGRVR